MSSPKLPKFPPSPRYPTRSPKLGPATPVVSPSKTSASSPPPFSLDSAVPAAAQGRKFGWKRDKPDTRDLKFEAQVGVSYPPTYDIRSKNPKVLVSVYDQGNLGSCVANGACYAYEFCDKKQNPGSMFSPARLFTYYNARALDGTVEEDAGTYIRTGIKTLNKFGVCDEYLWPYVVGRFKDKPTSLCFTDAKLHSCVQYKRVTQSVDQLKYAISQNLPVVFGFEVYDSFMKIGKDGIMPVPDPKKERMQGGHAVVAVGYNDKYFIVRNSWGPEWGDNGYFYMPIQVMTSPMASDFWVVQKVTPPGHVTTLTEACGVALKVCKSAAYHGAKQALSFAKTKVDEFKTLPPKRQQMIAGAAGVALIAAYYLW